MNAAANEIEPPAGVKEIEPIGARRLKLTEIFYSLQGEADSVGFPTVFVRLTGCPLRCQFCDTAYAFHGGEKLTLDHIVDRLEEIGTRLVEITGGEPLIHNNAFVLAERLLDRGFTVLVETSGAIDVSPLDPRVHKIMDLKCPSSGEVTRNRWDNIPHLKAIDELKCVIGTVEDYEWTKQILAEHRLAERCTILISWVAPLSEAQRDKSLKTVPEGQTPISRLELAERVIADKLPVRFQVQMHKVIWSPEARGV